MNYDYSAKTIELQKQLAAFMDEHIYPNEVAFTAEIEAGDRWQPNELIEDLKDRDTAFQFYAQSLAMARELGVRDGMVHGLNNLAVIFVLRGQLVQADKQLAEGEQLAEEIGHRQTIALLTYNRALLTWYQGDAAASRAHLLQAQTMAQAIASTHLLRRIEDTLKGLDAAALPSERPDSVL